MQYSKEEILAMSEGGFFGQGNAQLPNDLMLMIDEIDAISAQGGKFDKGQLCASLTIVPEQWFFACHFKGDPVMPGCLGHTRYHSRCKVQQVVRLTDSRQKVEGLTGSIETF